MYRYIYTCCTNNVGGVGTGGRGGPLVPPIVQLEGPGTKSCYLTMFLYLSSDTAMATFSVQPAVMTCSYDPVLGISETCTIDTCPPAIYKYSTCT